MKTLDRTLTVTGVIGLLVLTPAYAYAQEHTPTPTTSQDIVLDISDTTSMRTQLIKYVTPLNLYALFTVVLLIYAIVCRLRFPERYR